MDVQVRPARIDEAAAIADLLNEQSRRLWGGDAITADLIEHWFTQPGIDPDRDLLVAEAAEGTLLGYADVQTLPEKTRFWIDLRVLPDANGAGDALLAALEARAREQAAPGALCRGFFAESDETARRVFAARGYELVRHSLRMGRSLAEEPERPDWPEGLELRTAESADLEAVWRAGEDGFADHWEFHPTPFDEFAHWAEGPDMDHSLWFLAMAGEEIAGGCLCRTHDEGDREAGHVASLYVRPPWRRRGLALAFLLHSFGELRRIGRKRVTLGVDAENTTGAVRLYERAGMTIAQRRDVVDKPLG